MFGAGDEVPGASMVFTLMRSGVWEETDGSCQTGPELTQPSGNRHSKKATRCHISMTPARSRNHRYPHLPKVLQRQTPTKGYYTKHDTIGLVLSIPSLRPVCPTLHLPRTGPALDASLRFLGLDPHDGLGSFIFEAKGVPEPLSELSMEVRHIWVIKK